MTRPPARTERLAAIDVGTNTVRMLMADAGTGGLRPLLRMRRITGMGRVLRTTGAIGRDELLASLATLKAFRREMDRLGVARYRACGTAALREASNREEFLRAAADRAGVCVEVVTAAEEARRTWEGIRWRLAPRAGTLVMDIGGGSTEFIDGPDGADSVSLPIGVVVLCETFPLSDPPARWQLSNLRHFLAERIGSGTRRWSRKRVSRLVGTAGTFTTLAALDLKMTEYRPERIDGHRMALPRLKAWEERLVGLTDAGRLALPGMEKGRERYIVPGVCQAVLAMERFGAGDLVASDAGILEGIIKGLVDDA